MRLRFTRTAARQLEKVLDHIAQHSPSGASNDHARIRDLTQLLLQYPYAGQATERPGIRRVVASPYPYIVTYRVGDGEVVIRTVRHGARRPLS